MINLSQQLILIDFVWHEIGLTTQNKYLTLPTRNNWYSGVTESSKLDTKVEVERNPLFSYKSDLFGFHKPR